MVSKLDGTEVGIGYSMGKRLPWEDFLKAKELQSVFKNE